MSLPEKYDLLDLIAENETRTYLARERTRVRMVMVHILLPGPNRISLLELVLRTRLIPNSPGRLQILDLGEHEGNPFVVTEIIPGFRTLREWLQAELTYAASPAIPAQPVAPPPTAAPQPRRDPGEFTQLFQAVMAELPTTAPGTSRPVSSPSTAAKQGSSRSKPERPSTPPPPGPAPTAPAAGSEPGEFTRMFQSAPPAAPAAPPPLSGQPRAGGFASTLPPSSREPGEFTRMFQAGPAEQPPPPPQPAAPAFPPPPPTAEPAAGEPGEFTRLFLQGTPISPAPTEPGIPSELPAAPPTGAEPGEFTRMFESPLAPSPLEQQAASYPAPRAPQSGPQPGSAWPAPGVAALPGYNPALQAGPPGTGLGTPAAGEFTRLFGTPSTAGSAATPPASGLSGGGATQLFSTAAAPVPPADLAQPAPSGPGEFTRIVSGAPLEPVEPLTSAPPGEAAPAAATRSANVPLFIIAGSILVIVLLLALYFVLRR